MKITIPCTFLKAESSKFKGSDGSDVDYKRVSLLTAEGDFMQVGVDAGIAMSDISVSANTQGEAVISLTAFNGKPRLKFVSFEEQ